MNYQICLAQLSSNMPPAVAQFIAVVMVAMNAKDPAAQKRQPDWRMLYPQCYLSSGEHHGAFRSNYEWSFPF